MVLRFHLLQEVIKVTKGLGDSIKKITDRMGIKQCGKCKQRQEFLNRIVPYKGFNVKEILKGFKKDV